MQEIYCTKVVSIFSFILVLLHVKVCCVASALGAYMACVVSWAIDGKLLTPRPSVFSLWTEAVGSSRLWLLGTGKAICCHHRGPFAACPPPAEGLTSDQNVHCMLSWLLFCLGFRLFIQQEMFPGFDGVPLLSSPEQLRTRSPAHMAVFPLIKFTFNYTNTWTAWKLTTNPECSFGISGK